MHMIVQSLRGRLSEIRKASVDERVQLYNALVQLVADELLYDLPPDPSTRPQLLPAEHIHANSYNPNRVAAPELDALEESMTADGITMCVVVSPHETLEGEHEVTDGFHRHHVSTQRLGRRFVPCSVLYNKTKAERMASTVRHNRARGKHDVELMGALVRSMLELGWDDNRIAHSMRMSPEELLRLKQTVGVARLLASPEYTRPWPDRDGDETHSAD